MYDKLEERNSIDNEDAHGLLSTSEEDSYPRSPRSSYLLRVKNLITFERVLLLFLLAALSFCVYRLIIRDHCAANSATHPIFETYGRDVNYMTLDHAKDRYWNDLVPYGVPAGTLWSADGNADGKETAGAISMFHQLHCLTSIRKALQNATDGGNPGIDWHDNGHWPHCFDYLRKTILCVADGTIERPIDENGNFDNFIDGQNDKRQCGQSTLLYDLLRQKAYDGEAIPAKDN